MTSRRWDVLRPTKKALERAFASQLMAASVFERLRLRRRMEQEIARRLNRAASGTLSIELTWQAGWGFDAA
jgi:hypothetical protein